jgi:hypothetical protein
MERLASRRTHLPRVDVPLGEVLGGDGSCMVYHI